MCNYFKLIFSKKLFNSGLKCSITEVSKSLLSKSSKSNKFQSTSRLELFKTEDEASIDLSDNKGIFFIFNK